MTRYDGDTERTFAALPPAPGRGFAQTWWGMAWLKALEDAALDTGQVKTGRRLARAGAVGAVSVRPGRITAVVQDRDRTAHRADVLLEKLSDAQWDRFADMAIERSGHVAALLDHDMPPHLVEDAAAAGIDLLPGLGDLEPECDCGAWDHCGHTAALCYQVARLLDQDPFVLLLMRGRDQSAVLDALQTHGGSSTEAASSRPVGVDAAEAYAAGHVLPPLPAPPRLREGPGTPPSLDTETAPPPGVDPAAVAFLASQAAVEAHRLLAEALRAGHGGQAVGGAPTVSQDAVRLAAGNPDRPCCSAWVTGRNAPGKRWPWPSARGGSGALSPCPYWRRSGRWTATRSHARVRRWSRPGTRTNGRRFGPGPTGGPSPARRTSSVWTGTAVGGRTARSGVVGCPWATRRRTRRPHWPRRRTPPGTNPDPLRLCVGRDRRC